MAAAWYTCIKENQYDGKRAYKLNEHYLLTGTPPADFFTADPLDLSERRLRPDNEHSAQTDADGCMHVSDCMIFENDVEFEENTTFETLITNSIELNTAGPLKPWKAGQIQFDPSTGAPVADTAFENVRYNYGEELWYPACNNTGATLTNGTVVYASGVNVTQNALEISKAQANSPLTSLQTLGFVTADIEDGECGKVTYFGRVGSLDTSSYSEGGVLWLSADTPGLATQTKPSVGNQLILLGAVVKQDASDGEFWATVNITSNEVPAYKSETFSSRGVGAGTYYLFGDYIAPATDITLTNASGPLPFGTANSAYGMRPFAVFAGDGTVDSGQVGLRWVSTSITDSGVRTASDVQIITTDITAPITDEYIETTKKIIGAGQYELYVVSGTPLVYSVSFNYGLAKYEDYGNRDFLLTDFEAVGLGGANDTTFSLEVLKHTSTGWTYSAVAFVPGDGIIADISSIYAPEDNIVNGEPFHFKLDSTVLSEAILGSTDEGVLVRIVTNQNNTIQYLNCHIGASF